MSIAKGKVGLGNKVSHYASYDEKAMRLGVGLSAISPDIHSLTWSTALKCLLLDVLQTAIVL